MKVERPDIANNWPDVIGNIVTVDRPDSYVIRLTINGLDSKGDPAQHIITLTRNELAHINRHAEIRA